MPWSPSWSPSEGSVAHHPDFGLVPYRFEAIPDDPDAQVRLMIHRMIGLALKDSQTTIIQDVAAEALQLGNGNPIKGVWSAVKPFMQFRQDYDIAQDLETDEPRRKAETVETLIEPSTQAMLIRLKGRGVGDCDCFTAYAACLLTALGVPCSMCTVAAERERPREYTHVYLVAYWNGERIPMDLSHGPHIGWECPNLGRIREWPVCAETIRPSVMWPLLLAAAFCGLMVWGHA